MQLDDNNQTTEKKNSDSIITNVLDYLIAAEKMNLLATSERASNLGLTPVSVEENNLFVLALGRAAQTLSRRKKYLQIALNNDLIEARGIINQLPLSDKILIEVGTPLIKIYGSRAIKEVRNLAPSSYLVADAKVTDLAEREVELLAEAGANAVTCLGVAPLETIQEFINACKKYKVDSMIDMMNVDSAISILKKLKKLPTVVILHRGVDETDFSKEKMIPYYQIKQIKGSFNLIVSVAGGDTPKEIQSAFFNDADIVVVWKNFMQADDSVGKLAESFLKEIK